MAESRTPPLVLFVSMEYATGWWEVKDSTGLIFCYGETVDKALASLPATWRGMWRAEPDKLPAPSFPSPVERACGVALPPGAQE